MNTVFRKKRTLHWSEKYKEKEVWWIVHILSMVSWPLKWLFTKKVISSPQPMLSHFKISHYHGKWEFKVTLIFSHEITTIIPKQEILSAGPESSSCMLTQGAWSVHGSRTMPQFLHCVLGSKFPLQVSPSPLAGLVNLSSPCCSCREKIIP